MRRGYSASDKRRYMKLFFEGAAPEFCESVIGRLMLPSWNRELLSRRYVRGESDKQIANTVTNVPLSKDHTNKEIEKSLEIAYDALKIIQQQVWCEHDKS